MKEVIKLWKESDVTKAESELHCENGYKVELDTLLFKGEELIRNDRLQDEINRMIDSGEDRESYTSLEHDYVAGYITTTLEDGKFIIEKDLSYAYLKDHLSVVELELSDTAIDFIQNFVDAIYKEGEVTYFVHKDCILYENKSEEILREVVLKCAEAVDKLIITVDLSDDVFEVYEEAPFNISGSKIKINIINTYYEYKVVKEQTKVERT